jgi:diketogulonate reductase-like aldo/keto reductase
MQQVDEASGIAIAQVALEWVLQNPSVSAPIVDPAKPHHPHAVAAPDFELTDKEIAIPRGAPHPPRAHWILTERHPPTRSTMTRPRPAARIPRSCSVFPVR